MFQIAGSAKATWLLRLTVVALAVAAYVWALPTAFGLDGSSSSSSYSYGHAYGKNKVPICHKGKTKFVPLPAVAAHLAHGDTPGPCP
jgi:hypothetical protein